jgi:hypothetical protein
LIFGGNQIFEGFVDCPQKPKKSCDFGFYIPPAPATMGWGDISFKIRKV